MKKSLLFALLLAVALVVSGCYYFQDDAPESVTVYGEEYRTGFYGDLYPVEDKWKDEEYYQVKENEFGNYKNFTQDGMVRFYEAEKDGYRLLMSSLLVGIKGDTVYCAAEHWDDAADYYADDKSFTYHYIVGNIFDKPKTVKVENPDREMFARLSEFSRNDTDNVLSSNAAAGNEVVTMPASKAEKSSELTFFKSSKDGFFESYKGSHFRVIDGAMYLDFEFDGDDNYKGIVVPEELSGYFIELVNNDL